MRHIGKLLSQPLIVVQRFEHQFLDVNDVNLLKTKKENNLIKIFQMKHTSGFWSAPDAIIPQICSQALTRSFQCVVLTLNFDSRSLKVVSMSAGSTLNGLTLNDSIKFDVVIPNH